MEQSSGALRDVKVLDLTQFGAGPYCTEILADMGADVFKVEQPGGDPARYHTPRAGDIGGYFAAVNRNKRSITLNLKTPRGREILERLVRWADVFAENFRPGVIQRLGFGYQQVHAINPRIVMVSVSGFGQDGPYAKRPAFDHIAQAMSGLMMATQCSNEQPHLVGTAIADMTAGVYAALGVVMALYHRQRTNEGQYVDVSLLDSLVSLMRLEYVRRRLGGNGGRSGQFFGAPMGAFKTRDGGYVYIMAQDDGHWRLMAGVMGCPEMADDERFNARAKRVEQRDYLNGFVAKWVAAHTVAEVEKVLDKVGVPFGPVLDVHQVFTDPHLKQRGAIREFQHPTVEMLPLVGPLPRLSLTPGAIRHVSPTLGQHNTDVYQSVLGMTAEEILQLREQGVI